MKYITLTPAQKKDIRDGKTVTISTKDGTPIIVTPFLVEYAKQMIAAGGDFKILAEVPGQNRMEEISVTV